MDVLAPLFPVELGYAAGTGMLAASFVGSFVTVSLGIGGGALLMRGHVRWPPVAAFKCCCGCLIAGSGARWIWS